MGYGMKYTKGGFPFKHDETPNETTNEQFNTAGENVFFAEEAKTETRSKLGPTVENLAIKINQEKEDAAGEQIKRNKDNTTRIFGNQ